LLEASVVKSGKTDLCALYDCV